MYSWAHLIFTIKKILQPAKDLSELIIYCQIICKLVYIWLKPKSIQEPLSYEHVNTNLGMINQLGHLAEFSSTSQLPCPSSEYSLVSNWTRNTQRRDVQVQCGNAQRKWCSMWAERLFLLVGYVHILQGCLRCYYLRPSADTERAAQRCGLSACRICKWS